MSPARALAWELALRHRWGLSAIASYAPALVLVRAFILPDVPAGDESLLALTVVMPLSVSLFYLLIVFTFGSEGDLGGRASLFPGRLCRLPLSTTALTGWFVLFATTTVVALWVATWFAALRPAGLPLPLVWPALFLAVFVTWMQALTWLPYGLPFLRVIVTIVCLTTVDVAGLLALEYRVAEPLMLAILAPQLPLAFLVARYAVASARRGHVPDWRFPRARRRASSSDVRSVRGFASRRRAQLWYEWRHHGLALPVLVAIVVPCELLLLFAAHDAPVLAGEIVLCVALTPALLAPFVAATVRKAGGGATDAHRLTAFQATRPITSANLVAAKLLVAAASTLLAFAVVGISIPAGLNLSNTGHMITAMWERLRVLGTPRATAIVGGAVALLVLGTWKQLVQSLYVGLSGRPWVVRIYMTLMLALLFSLIPLYSWIRDDSAVRRALWDALPWIAAIGVAAKLAVGSWLALRLRRAKLLSTRALLASTAGWLAAAAASYALLQWLIAPAMASRGLLAAAALLVIPLARLWAAPLALAANRHR